MSSVSIPRVVKESANETRYYISPGFEKIVTHGTGESRYRFTLFNGTEAVATFEKNADADSNSGLEADRIAYIHRDMIGSGELITGADMQVMQRRYFTPYGELVDESLGELAEAHLMEGQVTGDQSSAVEMAALQDAQDVTLLSEAKHGAKLWTDDLRGFTSHEHDVELGLINMNARLYDPVIGQFVAADTVIPDAMTPFGYNRYMYVRGNPVMYTDPSGHAWAPVLAAFAFFTEAQRTDNRALQMFSSAVLSAAIGKPLSEFGWFGLAEGWVASGLSHAATNLTMTYLQTGRITSKDMNNAGFALLSAGLANGIAHTKLGKVLGTLDVSGNITANVVGHTLAQGIVSQLRGDRFLTGAVSGFVGKLASQQAGRMFGETFAATALVTVAGGLAAEATGGDFMDGAMQAMAVHLYNDLKSDVVDTVEELRTIPEFAELEERFGTLTFTFDDTKATGILGNVVNINSRILTLQYRVDFNASVDAYDESLPRGMDNAEFFSRIDTYEATLPSWYDFSLRRVIAHEAFHLHQKGVGGVAYTAGIDWYEAENISRTNSFMFRYFNEPYRSQRHGHVRSRD